MNRTPQIFIIDDVADNIEVLGQAIASAGEVSFALSGEDGLARIRQRHPDLILLDVMMPGMNGYEVFAHLKASPDTAHIPVIFVTAKSDPQYETTALNAGAIDFLSKPINPTVALARVHMHLAHLARAREVQQLNGELEQRVQERTQALGDALAQSRAAQDAKASLLANMSHEFRTPLNAVLGMSYLASRKVSEPAVVEMLRKITESGNRLLGLLTGILDLAKIETQQLRIEKIPFALPTVVQASVELLRSTAVAKELEIETHIDAALAGELMGDPVRIGNVLTNFISNAIKFSSGGVVQLRLSAHNQDKQCLNLRMEVHDQGIGIAQQDQARIFELFEQLDGSSTRLYGGTGIGLAICKQLVSLMGGTIGVDSAPGQGSTFWAVIPLEQGAPPQPGTEEVSKQKAGQLLEFLCALLSNDDILAVRLWEAERAAFENALGPHAPALARAMEAYDLEDALTTIQLSGRLSAHRQRGVP